MRLSHAACHAAAAHVQTAHPGTHLGGRLADAAAVSGVQCSPMHVCMHTPQRTPQHLQAKSAPQIVIEAVPQCAAGGHVDRHRRWRAARRRHARHSGHGSRRRRCGRRSGGRRHDTRRRRGRAESYQTGRWILRRLCIIREVIWKACHSIKVSQRWSLCVYVLQVGHQGEPAAKGRQSNGRAGRAADAQDAGKAAGRGGGSGSKKSKKPKRQHTRDHHADANRAS